MSPGKRQSGKLLQLVWLEAVINVLFSLILTAAIVRVYGLENFGIYKTCIVVIAFCGGFYSFGANTVHLRMASQLYKDQVTIQKVLRLARTITKLSLAAIVLTTITLWQVEYIGSMSNVLYLQIAAGAILQILIEIKFKPILIGCGFRGYVAWITIKGKLASAVLFGCCFALAVPVHFLLLPLVVCQLLEINWMNQLVKTQITIDQSITATEIKCENREISKQYLRHGFFKIGMFFRDLSSVVLILAPFTSQEQLGAFSLAFSIATMVRQFSPSKLFSGTYIRLFMLNLDASNNDRLQLDFYRVQAQVVAYAFIISMIFVLSHEYVIQKVLFISASDVIDLIRIVFLLVLFLLILDNYISLLIALDKENGLIILSIFGIIGVLVNIIILLFLPKISLLIGILIGNFLMLIFSVKIVYPIIGFSFRNIECFIGIGYVILVTFACFYLLPFIGLISERALVVIFMLFLFGFVVHLRNFSLRMPLQKLWQFH